MRTKPLSSITKPPRHRLAPPVLVAFAFLATLSCSDPQVPDRSISYGFTDGFGEVFRWPQDRSPVPYWVEDRGDLLAYVNASLVLWQRQFLYGEWSSILVEDSSGADVLVFLAGGTPPSSPLTSAPPVRACFGETAGTVVANAIEGAIRTTLFWSQGATAADIANCLSRVTAHEIGHTLGLLAHSGDTGDLMFTNPMVTVPSLADKNTVQKLYNTTPTLAPPTR